MYKRTRARVLYPGMRYLMALGLGLMILLAGCSNGTALPTSLPDLHGPGVTKVPGLEQILNRYDLIPALGTYTLPTRPPSTPVPTSTSKSNTRIVAELGFGDGGAYYDIGIDGNNPHPLPLPVPCYEYLSITQDGEWGACLTSQGIAGVTVFRLTATGPSSSLEEHTLIPIDATLSFSDLAWDPTGHYLAIARTNRTGGDFAPLDIFAVTGQHNQARLVVRFSGSFSINEVRWSPDGRWLIVRTTLGQQYLLPLWQLVPNLPKFGAAPLYLTISTATFQEANNGVGVAWRVGTPTQLTWVDSTGRVLGEDVTTGKTHIVAKLGYPSNMIGEICSATWTADGKQFIFALCKPASGDYLGLPPKLFVYSADAGTEKQDARCNTTSGVQRMINECRIMNG